MNTNKIPVATEADEELAAEFAQLLEDNTAMPYQNRQRLAEVMVTLAQVHLLSLPRRLNRLSTPAGHLDRFGSPQNMTTSVYWRQQRATARQVQTIAAADVLAERRRQVERLDRLPEYDDESKGGEIAAYAAYYAMPKAAREWPATETGYGDTFGEAIVPADWSRPKPCDRRRELVKAGALILAEIERLDRATAER